MRSWVPYDNLTEREIEDWAAFRMAPLIHPNARLLGRQVTLPSGRRLDLLFFHWNRGRQVYTVVELKAGGADASAVLQCLGYVRELRALEAIGLSTRPTVRGVVATDDQFTDDALILADELPNMATMTLYFTLEVSAWGLYDDPVEVEREGREQPARPPDVDRTRSRLEPSYGWRRDTVEGVEELILDLHTELLSDRRARPSVALAPLSLTPSACHTNGNG